MSKCLICGDEEGPRHNVTESGDARVPVHVFQSLKRYQIISWYARDASNQHSIPFARVVVVEAASSDEAYKKGDVELNRIYLEKNESVDFLNWFIKELK